jgi:hypothetical protein
MKEVRNGMVRDYQPELAMQIQEEAENLIAFMLRRDDEIRERLRRLAGLAQRKRGKAADMAVDDAGTSLAAQ